MNSSNRCVFVFAPAGKGKTSNADALAAMFGCETIVDEWDGQTPLPANALVLCNSVPPEAIAAACLA